MDAKNYVNFFLSQPNFITINSELIKLLEGDAITAVLLTKLVTSHTYFEDSYQLDQDGMFYQTVADIEHKFGFNDYHQRKSISKLEDLGVLSTKLKGMPPVRYFKINFPALQKLLSRFEDKKTGIAGTQAKTKEEFYKQLNNNSDYDSIPTVSGNIHRVVAEFLFIFRKVTKQKWDSKTYGQVSNYLIKKYVDGGGVFSYTRLRKFLDSDEPKFATSFIKFDQTLHDDLERPVSGKDFIRGYNAEK